MINIRFILLSIIFNIFLFAKTFSAIGVGNDEASAKRNALKSLAHNFYVDIKSNTKIIKKSNNKSFLTTAKSNLDISSDINIPHVQYKMLTSKTKGQFKAKAIVLEKDIISFMHNSQILLKSISKYSENELIKALKDIDNNLKLFLAVEMEDKKSFIKEMQFYRKKINSILYDGILVFSDDKEVKILIDDKEIKLHKIFVESEIRHNIKAIKKGYFKIEQTVYLRSGESKNIEFNFIKNKKRKINFINTMPNYMNKVLKNYKIINDKTSKISLKITYKINEEEERNLIKISINGKNILKIKNKDILIENSYNKTCRKQKKEKCLKLIKKQTTKELIKMALKRIDDEN
jgi:hypothetical protein